MLPDNRLDFISLIEPNRVNQMSNIRAMYIALDSLIAGQFPDYPQVANAPAVRAAQLARTNLEISLQYAIKTFCLLGEIKPEFEEVTKSTLADLHNKE